MELTLDDFKKLVFAARYFAIEAEDHYDSYGKPNAMLEVNAKNIIDFLVRATAENGEKYTPTHTPFIHYYIYEIELNGKDSEFCTDDGEIIHLYDTEDLYSACLDWA